MNKTKYIQKIVLLYYIIYEVQMDRYKNKNGLVMFTFKISLFRVKNLQIEIRKRIRTTQSNPLYNALLNSLFENKNKCAK